MLTNLHVQNFAIIDKIEIDFKSGLTVLTGETGAGKSLIIDAIGLLVGAKASPNMVRSGASKAIIEGVFDNINSQIKEFLTNLEIDEIDELKDLFEEFINYSKCENEQAKASHKVSNLLSSAILRVLIDIAEGKEIDIDDIENGEYDKIPERFLKILKQGSKG